MQNERKLSKAVEKIAKRLPDAEFKKRYGKNWMAVKIATAEKLAEKFMQSESCGCDACQDEIKERKGKTSRNRKKKKATKKRDRCLRIADRKFDKPSAYKSGAVVRCRKGDIWKGIKEDIHDLVEKETLKKWFDRQGAPGKTGGWVDCNAPIRKDGEVVGYKPCGRQKGEKRAKYPSCRPTPARCKDPGKGKSWGKTTETELRQFIREVIKNTIK